MVSSSGCKALASGPKQHRTAHARQKGALKLTAGGEVHDIINQLEGQAHVPPILAGQVAVCCRGKGRAAGVHR